MSTEDKSKNIGAPQEERSLVVRQGASGIQRISEGNVLQAVHFSPLLPERLGRLNDVLAPEVNTPIKEISITLFPGKNPIIDTDILPEYAYVAQLKASRSGEASLEILARKSLGDRGLLLKDLQDFVETSFPGKAVRLHAFTDRFKVQTLDDLDEDLFVVTNERARELTEMLMKPSKRVGLTGQEIVGSKYPKSEIRVESLTEALVSMSHRERWNRPARDENDKVTVFHIDRFFYKGTPEDVEAMIDTAVKLFDKDPYYPYRWEDMFPEEA